VSASVIFIWLTDPDGGIVDWPISRMPSWLGGCPPAHLALLQTGRTAAAGLHAADRARGLHGFPFVAVSRLAGLNTIPAEAARIRRVDGEGPWRALLASNLPLLKPIFLVCCLLSIIWAFGVFTQPTWSRRAR